MLYEFTKDTASTPVFDNKGNLIFCNREDDNDEVF